MQQFYVHVCHSSSLRELDHSVKSLNLENGEAGVADGLQRVFPVNAVSFLRNLKLALHTEPCHGVGLKWLASLEAGKFQVGST